MTSGCQAGPAGGLLCAQQGRFGRLRPGWPQGTEPGQGGGAGAQIVFECIPDVPFGVVIGIHTSVPPRFGGRP